MDGLNVFDINIYAWYYVKWHECEASLYNLASIHYLIISVANFPSPEMFVHMDQSLHTGAQIPKRVFIFKAIFSMACGYVGPNNFKL